MTARTSRPTPLRGELFLIGFLLLCGAVVLLMLLAYRLGGGAHPSWNPAILVEVAAGRRDWPTAAGVILAAELFAITTAATSAAYLLARRNKDRRSRPVDAVAKTMTNPHRLELFDEKWSTGETKRLAPGIPAEHPAYRGVLVGHAIRGDLPVYLPWEWVTTGERGEASFWWNPQAPVFDLPSAKEAASYFVGAEKEDGAKVDAYFDGAAQDLLASYRLAARLAGGDLIHAVEWMANEQSQVPAAVLLSHDQLVREQR